MKSIPQKLRTVEEMAGLIGISTERLLELANDGFVPHLRIDDGPIMFQRTKVERWVAENLMCEVEGMPLPTTLTVSCRRQISKDVFHRPPSAIGNIPNLAEVPLADYGPGVYFLCYKDEVVYVGQSVNPSARIPAHFEDKKFDRAYVANVPRQMLSAVEGAFIRTLDPKLNKAAGPLPWNLNKDDDEILEEYIFQYDLGGTNGEEKQRQRESLRVGGSESVASVLSRCQKKS